MITAKEVRESVFSRSARGYKVSEIDDFLEDVAVSIEQLCSENESLLKKMELLAAKVQEYREDEDNIRAALLTAQRSADQIVREANEEKERILLDANAKAKAIMDDANAHAQEALKTSQEKSLSIVNETKEKATLVINEAKDKAGRLLSDAKEGSREEQEKFEQLKKQALDFRAALIQMYKDQFEMIKNGGAHKMIKSAPEPEKPAGEEEPQEETPSVLPKKEKSTEPESQEPADQVPADPEDIPIPVSNSLAEKMARLNLADDPSEEAEKISGGFKVEAPAGESKFSDLKFGKNYDISQDEDDDEEEEEKGGFFARRRK